jgi:hypothetical protein
MEFKKEILDLDAGDNKRLKKQIGLYRIGQIISFFVLGFGALAYTLWDNPFIVFMLAILGLGGVAGFSIMIKRVKDDLKNAKKTRITGKVTQLEIKQSANQISYEKLPNNRVKIEVKTPSGFENYEQDYVLGAGEKDLFFYILHIGAEKLRITRQEFFSLDEGDPIEVEYSESREILSLVKVN